MYANGNPRTKKALKEALAKGEKIGVFSPGLGGYPKGGGTVYLEGPHYPEPHRWYASCKVDEHGIIIPGSVK